MTGKEEAAYRFRVAATLVVKAEGALGRQEWREAALFARAAIENAAKAVLGVYASVPRSHEPGDILQEAASLPAFSASLREEALALAARFRGYGMEQHILLSYGDEAHHVDPWSLVRRESAEDGVADARLATDFASRCIELAFGGTSA
jgi:HEPN domain-containing protein